MQKLIGAALAACLASFTAPAIAADAPAPVQTVGIDCSLTPQACAPAPAVEGCVSIPAALAHHPASGTPLEQGEVLPLILVWGYSDPNPGCGLKLLEGGCPIDCAPGATAYVAPGFNGNHDLLIPRVMAIQMQQICIVPNNGYGPAEGIWINEQLVVQDVRPRAASGQYIVLPNGAAIKFWPLGNS